MPGDLFDTNVWVAAMFSTHLFHRQAQAALANAHPFGVHRSSDY